MSAQKSALFKACLSAGLGSANRGNIFWTRSDAMSSFAIFHKNARRAQS